MKSPTNKVMKQNPALGSRLTMLFVSFLIVFTSCSRNEFPPEIADQEFFVDENSPQGTIIGILAATDQDENSLLSFEILEGNSDFVFLLDQRTGVITVNDPSKLDFEKTREFILIVRVIDNDPNDPLESESTIKITVRDLNEFSPELSDQLFQVSEFPLNGFIIGKILATDNDKEQSLLYKIESGNDDGAILLDSLSGDIIVADSSLLDYDVHKEIKCMISATDDHPVSPRKTYGLLTIEVLKNDSYKVSIVGTIQKGPFIQGSVITVLELDELLKPTGRTFQTTVQNNSGSFQLEDIELESQYVQLKADGFYFNETFGELSKAQLTLLGIADVSSTNSININLLTHLERGRIQQLIGQGLSFEEAKTQAQQEILNVFSIVLSEIRGSELLDISQANDDNAVLLAISIIMQGYRSEAELSELLAMMIMDLEPDGNLDDRNLQSKLINQAHLLQPDEIRSNLENRYTDLGISFELPDFEKYLTMFIENSGYEITNLISYPINGIYGNNILFQHSVELESKVHCSMAAILPGATSLQIKLSGGKWYYQVLPNPPKNWEVSAYDKNTKSQTFTSIEPGTDCDLDIHFSSPIVVDDSINTPYITNDYIKVEYFENMSATPTFEKTVHLYE